MGPVDGPPGGAEDLRVEYNDRDYPRLARKLGVMNDEKAGIRRTAYGGVVTFHRGTASNGGPHRVFLVPDGFDGTFPH